jgi:hypothetical protein
MSRGLHSFRRLVLGAWLLVGIGCETTYYDEYRDRHPGFEGTLPRDDAPLEEVLAALHSPGGAETIEVGVAWLEIARIDGATWTPVDFAAIRSGQVVPSDAHDYAVLVSRVCRFSSGLSEERALRSGQYLLAGNRLVAYDHYEFRDRCAARNQFRAARDVAVPVEREAVRRLAARGAGPRLGLAETFRRGLSYVEAGRLTEAQAMLVLGERGYRTATAQLPADAPLPDPIVEAARYRATLMRALGVVTR